MGDSNDVNDDKPRMIENTVKTHSKQWIAGEAKPGIFITTEREYKPNQAAKDKLSETDQAALKFDTYYNSQNKAPLNERVLTRLDEIEAYAQEAKQNTITSDVASKVKAEAGSILSMTHRLEKDVKVARYRMGKFEQATDDTKAREEFYWSMLNMIDLACDLMQLSLKRHEKEAMRGSDQSYNHTGATTAEQTAAVRRFHELQQGENPLGPNKAALQVADENNCSKSTVFGWVGKHTK